MLSIIFPICKDFYLIAFFFGSPLRGIESREKCTQVNEAGVLESEMCEPESQREKVDRGDHSCPEPRFRDAESATREGTVDQKPEAGAASSCHGWCRWTTRAAAWRLWHSARTFL